jgi:hypothetical protein
MTSTTDATWSELFPKGRNVYYEGANPERFAAEVLAEFGFDPSSDENWGGDAIMPGPYGERFADPFGRIYLFHCPAQHLDAIYASGRWEMGS